MSNEDKFKQQLAERLINVNSPQVDAELWQKIESEITVHSVSKKSYWLVAASIFAVMAIGSQLQLTQKENTVQLSPELYFIDVELQQAIIENNGSARYEDLYQQRLRIEHNQMGSYQL